MTTLTIRDLEDSLMLSLRMRAARHSRSMEEEAQQNLASRIRARVAAVGGVEMRIAPRELAREPPDLGAVVRPRKPARGAP